MIKDSKKCKIIYMVISILIFSVIYFPILLSGNMYMFIDIGADTYSSYWPSLSYAANLLTDIKMWDTSLGLGASTFIQISYFMLDPFNWIIFLFEPFNMDIGLFISLCLKYIALSTVSYLYFTKMQFNGWARIFASLSVVFSGWFIGWGQHYNFATMFVFFIALLYFLECWIRDKKWIIYICVLAWLSMMIPYYTYMILLFLAVYYLMRQIKLIHLNGIQKLVVHALKTAGMCIAGVALSGVIFLPLAADMLASPRVGGKLIPNLKFATKVEYISILFRMISNNILGINKEFYGYANWYESPYLYVGIIFLFLLPIFIKKYFLKRKYILITLLVLFAFIFPYFFGIIFNAFSTMSYRWTFLFIPVFGLFIGFGIAAFENEVIDNRVGESIVYITINAILFLYGFWILNNKEGDVDIVILLSVIIVFFVSSSYFIALILFKNRRNVLLIVLFGIFAFELCVNGYISVNQRNVIPSANKKEMAYFDDSQYCISYLKDLDKGFYRINKKYAYIDLNDSMIQHYNGEKIYSSILNDSYWKLQDMFDLHVKKSNYFNGFDDKQVLRDLNSVKYMLTDEKKEYYGYKYVKTFGNKHIYENLNIIPFGFLYESYVTTDEFENLNIFEKQEALYQACVIESKDELSIKEIEHKDMMQFSYLNEVNYNIAQTESEEIYLLFDKTVKPLVIKIEAKEDKKVQAKLFPMNQEQLPSTNSAITVNISEGEINYYNVNEINVDKLLISTTLENIENIEVYEKETNLQESEITNKRKNILNNIEWSDSYISGEINAAKNSLLYLPIIYDKKWTATVNGKIEKVYQVNGGFTAVRVKEGSNQIVVKYSNRIFIYGIITSVVTAVGLIGIIVWTVKKRRIKK